MIFELAVKVLVGSVAVQLLVWLLEPIVRRRLK